MILNSFGKNPRKVKDQHLTSESFRVFLKKIPLKVGKIHLKDQKRVIMEQAVENFDEEVKSLGTAR